MEIPYGKMTLLAGLIATMSIATTGSAQDAVTSSKTIGTRDLDLHSASGRAALRSRLRSAGDTVCGTSSGVADLATSAAEQKCREQAVRNGEDQANAIVAQQDAARAAELARAREAGRRQGLAQASARRRVVHHYRTRRVVHHRRARHAQHR